MVQTDKQKYENAIAKWLANLREEKNISQEFLAIQLGKGQSDIAKIENASKKATILDILSWMTALAVPYERIEEVLNPIYEELSGKNNYWNKK